MEVIINRRPIAVTDDIQTLGQLLGRENLDGNGVAVAVDNKLVKRDEWASMPLSEGMRITVIRAVCGG
ncbi:MAG: sulfur carrier protein ThiS [Clostridiales bacterium]|nr:sulfur carrier protein ThiS [Clostridiales bacterium]